MPVEGDFDNIDSLEPTFPFDDDQVAEGPQHLRGIKNALQGNVSGDDVETRLLVNGIIAALVDATGLSVIDLPTLRVINSVVSQVAELKLLNATGGWTWLNQADSSELLLLQLSAADALEKVAATFFRDGAFTAAFDGVEAFATIAPTRNSSAEVRDFAGAQHPIGYNTMPPTTIAGATTLSAIHNGRLLQLTGGSTLTLANPFAGFAFNILCAAATGFVQVPAGTTVQLYEGDGRRSFAGAASMALNLGSIMTFQQTTATSWNAWGGDVA